MRILNEHNDATKRQFPVGTVLEITCLGQIGSDPSNVSTHFHETELLLTSNHLPWRIKS